MQLTAADLSYLGLCLEGFLFGLYSGIFAVLWQYHTSKEATNKRKKDNSFYSLCVLYVLSGVDFALDTAILVNIELTEGVMLYRVTACQMAVFACCDFITQSILIRRCWIMWGHNFLVVIIPSILAFAFLVMWMASIGAAFISPREFIDQTLWGNVLALTSLTASMTVNALVTGLIVFKIFKVFRQVKIVNPSGEKSIGTLGGKKLLSVIFILIESGMVLFVIQLTRVMIEAVGTGKTMAGVYNIIISIHEMLNGITPTIIRVRVLMGSSFDDEPSLVEAVGSLRFASVAKDSDPGIGGISPDGLPDDPIPIPEFATAVKRGETMIVDAKDMIS